MNNQIQRRVENLETRANAGFVPLYRGESETPDAFWQRLCAAPLEVRQLRNPPSKPGHRWCWRTSAHIPIQSWREINLVIENRGGPHAEL